MQIQFADRKGQVHRSFLIEILGVTENPETISFAGGVPNSRLFPVTEIAEAAARVLSESGEVTSSTLPARAICRFGS